MAELDFKDYNNEALIKLVSDGIGSHRSEAASMELRRRLNADLCSSITILDKNIQRQSEVATKLTKAMYILAGVGILLAVIQIIIAVTK